MMETDEVPGVRVAPKTLDFGDQEQCTAVRKVIVIYNDLPIFMDVMSVTVDSPHFRIDSHFQMIIEPNESTQIGIAFYSKQSGQQTGTVRVCTMLGCAVSYVKGNGVANRVGLKPVYLMDLPLNKEYKHQITIDNVY
jgi:hypothetical protein